MKEELKSLKNPTRILTIFMFLAVFFSSIGADGLSQLIPGMPPVLAAGIVGVAAYAVTQYGTERRVVRAEELKDQEYQEDEIICDGDDNGIWTSRLYSWRTNSKSK